MNKKEKKVYEVPELELLNCVLNETIASANGEEDQPALYSVSNGWGPWV